MSMSVWVVGDSSGRGGRAGRLTMILEDVSRLI